MAGASLQTIYYDDQEVIDALKRLDSMVDDMTPVYRDIGEYLLPSTQDRFADEEDPEGQPWEPLSDKYRRRKKKNTDKILVLDGYMRDLLAYQASSNQLKLGSNQIQAATHQFGDDSRNISERPFLGISTIDQQEILVILHQHLARYI